LVFTQRFLPEAAATGCKRERELFCVSAIRVYIQQFANGGSDSVVCLVVSETDFETFPGGWYSRTGYGWCGRFFYGFIA